MLTEIQDFFKHTLQNILQGNSHFGDNLPPPPPPPHQDSYNSHINRFKYAQYAALLWQKEASEISSNSKSDYERFHILPSSMLFFHAKSYA